MVYSHALHFLGPDETKQNSKWHCHGASLEMIPDSASFQKQLLNQSLLILWSVFPQRFMQIDSITIGLNVELLSRRYCTSTLQVRIRSQPITKLS